MDCRSWIFQLLFRKDKNPVCAWGKPKIARLLGINHKRHHNKSKLKTKIMQIKACYYNQHWNIYLFVKDEEKWWEKSTATVKPAPIENGEGEIRLRKHTHTEIPCLYTFGIYYNERGKRPGHGGEWSSNPKFINSTFGLDLMDTSINNISCAVSRKWLKEQIGDDVKWEKDDIYEEYITEIKNVENKPHKWITLKEL